MSHGQGAFRTLPVEKTRKHWGETVVVTETPPRGPLTLLTFVLGQMTKTIRKRGDSTASSRKQSRSREKDIFQVCRGLGTTSPHPAVPGKLLNGALPENRWIKEQGSCGLGMESQNGLSLGLSHLTLQPRLSPETWASSPSDPYTVSRGS